MSMDYPNAGALPPLLNQLHSASTTPAVKEGAVKALDSLIQSSIEHATLICNEEVWKARAVLRAPLTAAIYLYSLPMLSSALLRIPLQLLSTLVSLLLSPGSPHGVCKAVVGALGNIAACNAELATAVVTHKALEPLTRLVSDV